MTSSSALAALTPSIPRCSAQTIVIAAVTGDRGTTGGSPLVTGAGSGIGKATALRLAADGAKVVVLSRTAKEIKATQGGRQLSEIPEGSWTAGMGRKAARQGRWELLAAEEP